MQMEFSDVKSKRITQKIKDITYGFIRIIQNLLPKQNSYYNIPDDIKLICAIYYDI